MEFPKLVYDDLYKFLMSAGIIIFIIGFIGDSYILLQNTFQNITFYLWVLLVIYAIISGIGIYIMQFAGEKWYKNQKHIDDKIKADTQIAKNTAQKMLQPEDITYDKSKIDGDKKSDTEIGRAHV